MMVKPGQMVYEETADQQNANIKAGNWKTSGSNLQTQTFYMHMLRKLEDSPYWEHFKPYTTYSIKQEEYETSIHARTAVIHDWGCGFGNGTALIQATFPASEVVGYDYSDECIKMAQYRWPTLDFKLGNINSPKDEADFIFSSHTIEHTEKPYQVVDQLRKLCKFLVVVVPPIIEGYDGGHTGAMLTDDWVFKLRPSPLMRIEYSTIRKFGEDGMMPESSVLLLWQGEL
jgi:2-polyprenyl-3-methyl-5-hydroxy-6-metoxy-1,4-benzoquinol methylase